MYKYPGKKPNIPDFPKNCEDLRLKVMEVNNEDMEESEESNHQHCVTVTEAVIKSPYDLKSYRLIELENGLRALLISDPATRGNNGEASSQSEDQPDLANAKPDIDDETDDHDEDDDEDDEYDEDEGPDDDDASDEESDEADEAEEPDKKKPPVQLAAAALCVGVGSFSDPDDIPGLSHFLEHMVFMGSEKYPDENDFDAFLKKHGGSSNAYTACDQTVFYFDVHREFLHPALDRFAQFFIKPLMKEETMDREIEAVDSEFTASSMSDKFRVEQMLCNMANPDHPMAKFMWGNSLTLRDCPSKEGVRLYERLAEYHARMYSSHYMTLAVQSKESLDDLQQMVVDIFSDMPNNGCDQPTFLNRTNPFDNSDFYKLYKVVPVQNIHQVTLTWSLPSQLQHYRVKPLHYLGWLLGHEGKGSILSYLKHPDRLWALDLFAGNNESNFEHNVTQAFFQVIVTLTDEGFDHVYEVITCVFEYLHMLQKHGAQEKIFREIQIIEDNSFTWKEECDPVDNVDDMCTNMQLFPAEEVISGELLLTEYKPQVIEACLAQLTPRRANIILMSSSFTDSDRCCINEKWFNTQYCCEEIDEDKLRQWESVLPNPDLHLPPQNEFLATDFSLRDIPDPSSQYPSVIKSTAVSKLWYKQDNTFKLPKAYAFFYLRNAVINETARSAAVADLFITSLNHYLSEVTYPASVALLSYDLSITDCGIEIKCYGFNHKLHKLFELIVDALVSFVMTEDVFSAMKKDLQKIYHNYYIQPSGLARDLRLTLLQSGYSSMTDRQRALESINMQDVISFQQRQLATHCFVEGLVQGNITTEEAICLEEVLVNRLQCIPPPDGQVPQMVVLKLPHSVSSLRALGINPADTNSVIINYYQYGTASLHHFTLLSLLMMLMEEPCFDYLRTREQLGYTVYNEIKNTHSILGFTVFIKSQAAKHSLCLLDSKIEAFLDEFAGVIESMGEEEFRHNVKALISLKQCTDSNLRVEVDRNWEQILSMTYTFDVLKRQIEMLEEISLSEFRKWFCEEVSPTRRHAKLSVQVQGNGQSNPTEQGHQKGQKRKLADCVTDDSMENDFTSRASRCQTSSAPKVVTVDDDKITNPINNVNHFKNMCEKYPPSKLL